MARAYYIVDSIKGGCGKTTFSIMLSQYLQKMDSGRNTCLLDFDFLGTGLLNLFLDEKTREAFRSSHCYLTEIIRGFNVGNKPFLYDCNVDESRFLIGFGESSYKSKGAFAVSSKFNYTPVTSYGVFRNGLKNILASGGGGASLDSQVNGGIQNVVMDMSPGMDTYSEIVKECMLDKRHSYFLPKNVKRYYFLMMGMDSSHIVAAQNYFQSFMDSEDKVPDKIFVVINDIQKRAKAISDSEVEVYKAVISEFKRGVKSIAKYHRKTHFLVLNHFDNYSMKLHLREALMSTKKSKYDNIFLSTPFRFWGDWDEESLHVVDTEDWKEIVNPVTNEKMKGTLLKCLTE